jgi:hypothetical protein
MGAFHFSRALKADSGCSTVASMASAMSSRTRSKRPGRRSRGSLLCRTMGLAHLACTAARPPPLRQPRDVFPVVRWPEDRTGACRGAPRAPSPRRSSRPLEPRSRGHLSARPADDDAASRGARAPRDLPRSPR